MPQVQVIGLETDGGVQAASNAVANLNQSIQRKQQLAIDKMQADINAKNATTEQDKLMWDRRKQIVASLEKAVEMNLHQNPQYMKMLGTTYGTDLYDTLMWQAGNLPTTPTNERALAEASKIRNEQDPEKVQALNKAEVMGALSGLQGGIPGTPLSSGSTDLGSGMADNPNVPPGTTANIRMGKAGSLSYPLNQKYTAEESRLLGADDTVQMAVSKAIPLIQSGVLKAGTGFLSKVATIPTEPGKGGEKEIANMMLKAKGTEAEGLVTAIGMMWLSAFGVAGQAFTESEQSLMQTLLSPSNKSEERLISDLQAFANIVNSRAKYVRTGSKTDPSSVLDFVGGASRFGALSGKSPLEVQTPKGPGEDPLNLR